MSEESDNGSRDEWFPKGKHKIELCRSFCELGFCPYGSYCIFAHGIEELSMHQPALKVRKCRNYHTNGYCRFGERCNFKHEKNAKPKKKKNLYKFHRILTAYPDVVLLSLTNRPPSGEDSFKQCKSFSSSESSCQ